VKRPRHWIELVNEKLPDAQRACVITSLERGRPLGDEQWTAKISAKLGLQYTLNPRGRPPEKAGVDKETMDVTFSAFKWICRNRRMAVYAERSRQPALHYKKCRDWRHGRIPWAFQFHVES